MSSMHRRNVLMLPMLIGFGPQAAHADDRLALADIERRRGGRIGVFALDMGSGATLGHREDERFLMCSTFKGLLGGLILARVDRGKETLSRMVAYTGADLIFTSPITKANLGKGAMSVGDLLQAMLEHSDNTAAILLMKSAGGPPGLTRFMRGLGDDVTRSDRYEPTSNGYNGVLDTTSPRAIVGSVSRLLLTDALTPDLRERLEAGMVACKPGLNRIRAVLPADWIAGDRPGTSVEAETNDYAIVRPPNRAPLIVAVYYDAPKLSMADREPVLREAGAVFVDWAKAGKS